MERVSTKWDIVEGTVLVILFDVLLCKDSGFPVSKGRISMQSILGIVCTTFQLGNIRRDKPNNGPRPSHDRCETDLGEAATLEDEEPAGECEECSSLGFLPGFFRLLGLGGNLAI